MGRSNVVGLFMVIVGTLGAVLGIGAALLGQQLVADVIGDADQALGLVADGLDAADVSIELAGAAVTDLETTVAAAADASESVAAALEDSGVLITEVARITGNDLPESIEAVDAAMPGLISVAGLIDNTLRAARLFGVDYNPDKPFDEAVTDLDRSLDGMPDDLRAQADLLEGSTADIAEIAETAQGLSTDFADLRFELRSTLALLDEYQSTAAAADELVSGLQADLAGRATILRALVLAFGLIFAAGQIVPLWVGSQLLRQDAPALFPHHENSTEEPKQ